MAKSSIPGSSSKKKQRKETTPMKSDQENLSNNSFGDLPNFDTERLEQKLQEIDSNSSKLDLLSSSNDQIIKLLKQSIIKPSSNLNDSTDSKETISLNGRETDESPNSIDHANVFGGGIDIDMLIQREY